MYCAFVLVRVLAVLLRAAVAVIVALIAGILSRADGASLPAVVLRGGAASGGALGLVLGLVAAVGAL